MPTADILFKALLMVLVDVLRYGSYVVVLGFSVSVVLFTLLEKLGISYPKRVRRACIPYIILLVGVFAILLSIFS